MGRTRLQTVPRRKESGNIVGKQARGPTRRSWRNKEFIIVPKLIATDISRTRILNDKKRDSSYLVGEKKTS